MIGLERTGNSEDDYLDDYRITLKEIYTELRKKNVKNLKREAESENRYCTNRYCQTDIVRYLSFKNLIYTP